MNLDDLWITQYLEYHEDLRELDMKLQEALQELEKIKQELNEIKARQF